MSFRTALLASAIGLSCASLPASAQSNSSRSHDTVERRGPDDGPPIGSRLGQRMEARGPAEAEAEAAHHGHELASCLVNRRRSDSQKLLAQIDDQGYRKAYKSLTSGQLDCFNMWDDATHVTEGRSFSMPPEVLRGFLAEELIKRDLPRYAGLPALPKQMVYSRPWYGGTNRHPSVDEMATCVSETAPLDTIGLLKSEAYTPAEMTAIQTLAPTLGACLRIGTKVDANRQTLRAALADALYQRVANPVPAVAAKQ
jgi:hypothetical protein